MKTTFQTIVISAGTCALAIGLLYIQSYLRRTIVLPNPILVAKPTASDAQQDENQATAEHTTSSQQSPETQQPQKPSTNLPAPSNAGGSVNEATQNSVSLPPEPPKANSTNTEPSHEAPDSHIVQPTSHRAPYTRQQSPYTRPTPWPRPTPVPTYIPTPTPTPPLRLFITNGTGLPITAYISGGHTTTSAVLSADEKSTITFTEHVSELDVGMSTSLGRFSSWHVKYTLPANSNNVDVLLQCPSNNFILSVANHYGRTIRYISVDETAYYSTIPDGSRHVFGLIPWSHLPVNISIYFDAGDRIIYQYLSFQKTKGCSVLDIDMK